MFLACPSLKKTDGIQGEKAQSLIRRAQRIKNLTQNNSKWVNLNAE
jgi:hypothetical protein